MKINEHIDIYATLAAAALVSARSISDTFTFSSSLGKETLQSLLIEKVDFCSIGTVCYEKKFLKEFLKKAKQAATKSLSSNSFSN